MPNMTDQSSLIHWTGSNEEQQVGAEKNVPQEKCGATATVIEFKNGYSVWEKEITMVRNHNTYCVVKCYNVIIILYHGPNIVIVSFRRLYGNSLP